MKKVFFIFILLSFHFIPYAQQGSPCYIDILKTFFKSYEPLEDVENYTRFAKKKEGWYITQINKFQSDRLLSEKLFFSFDENKYHDLSTDYTRADNPDIEKLLNKYLYTDEGTSDWYGFERIAYYGYNGWYIDMIKDFGTQQNISDTMHDGLGRAYVNLANSYSWYQSGGMFPEYDTLHRKLNRLEYPSAQRIEKIKEAIDNAIMQFEKLKRVNPVYLTIVGNSTLKLFNEYMHGYNQMIICGKDDLAKKYLVNAPLPEPYIIQAKNYLNSCEPNAILFSYGDNDTYQLWYVQEKYNFRKDVLVVNNSLLGLPVYIDMLKRKRLLFLSIPDPFLKDPDNDITFYVENKKITDSNKEISLKGFLELIYKKQFPYESSGSPIYPTYPYQTASLTLPVSWDRGTVNPAMLKKISFNLNEKYYYINDIATLDIILNNIHKRPVYFTSESSSLFENKLQQVGIVYKLIAEDIDSEIQKSTEIRALEKFVTGKYIPVLSTEPNLISFDGDNNFFSLYYKIFDYYLGKKDIINLKHWLEKFEEVCPKLNSQQIKAGAHLAYYLIESGDTVRGLSITEQYIQWLSTVYTTPSSLTGYYSEEEYISELTKTKDYLTSKNLGSPLLDSLLKK